MLRRARMVHGSGHPSVTQEANSAREGGLSGRDRQSLRTVLEMLILAALLWSGKTQMTLTTQIAVLQNNVNSLHNQLSDVPSLTVRTATMEMQVRQIERDVEELRRE